MDQQRLKESDTNASPDDTDLSTAALDSEAGSPTPDVRSPEGLGAVMVEQVRCKTGLTTAALDSGSPTPDVRSPEGLGAVMVEQVRCKTGLTHCKSQLAVATVLSLLAEHVPTTEKLVAVILDDVQHQHVCVC